ncbi:MAG: hypothetical protein WD042_09760 [Phycisphaeraceae bacterium]
MSSNLFRVTSLSMGLMLGAALLALGGCSQEQYALQSVRHSWASTDRYEFKSTVSRPLNLTLIENFTQEVLWSKELPVGQTLILNLDRQGEHELVTVRGEPATSLNWYVYNTLDADMPIEKGRRELVGTPVRLEVSYRPSPEYPPGYMPSTPVTKKPVVRTEGTPVAPPVGVAPEQMDKLREVEQKQEAQRAGEAEPEASPTQPAEMPEAEAPAPEVRDAEPESTPADLVP